MNGTERPSLDHLSVHEIGRLFRQSDQHSQERRTSARTDGWWMIGLWSVLLLIAGVAVSVLFITHVL